MPTTSQTSTLNRQDTSAEPTNQTGTTAREDEESSQQSLKKREALKKELAKLNYAGKQTITINKEQPTFTKAELTTKNGAWEKYYPLDTLNRATGAEALLNQSLMPTEKRGDISKVKPTGWRNKKIGGSYLYNRSHLIGFALAGENANWQNLITGTRQLNNPEMLRFEMDIKYYLEQDKKHFVRYEVTPVFRNDELLARGVHLMAQSVNSDAIKINVYIFNVQAGVKLNYQDGSSQILD
ncbi:DNA/RNA non-specific endonuclease [Enterococcus canintestini]